MKEKCNIKLVEFLKILSIDFGKVGYNHCTRPLTALW